MDEIVLHPYPTSSFSERLRLAFGPKTLAWRPVTIPPAMPEPDLLPLTGGYRRVSVMQIGAVIFCDPQPSPPTMWDEIPWRVSSSEPTIGRS